MPSVPPSLGFRAAADTVTGALDVALGLVAVLLSIWSLRRRRQRAAAGRSRSADSGPTS